MKKRPRKLTREPRASLARAFKAACVGMFALVSTAALLWAQSSVSLDDNRTPEKVSADKVPSDKLTSDKLPYDKLTSDKDYQPLSKTDHQIREGTEISEKTGYFRMTGDRVTFFTDDGKARLIGLENLNLERVARMIADNPDPLEWTVTGTVTEYRGANFLFVRRAILKTKLQTKEEPF